MRVSISSLTPDTLAKTVADMKKDGRTIQLEKERNPGDIMPDWTAIGVHAKNVKVQSMRRTGKFAINCFAILNIPNASDALATWAGNLCDSVEPEVPGIGGAEAAAATGATTAPEAPIGDFLAAFDGKSKSVQAAFKKYGASKLDTHSMDSYDLHDPQIVKSDKMGGVSCYEVHASAGMTKRGYQLCVVAGKIQRVMPVGDNNGLLPPG